MRGTRRVIVSLSLFVSAVVAGAGETPYTTEILATKVICKEPGRYIGWPTICRCRSGQLIAVFSGDRDFHVCPWGKTEMICSDDEGRSWSEPITINNTPLDDRDAGIIETKDGTLVISWFTSLAFLGHRNDAWRRHVEKLGPETRREWLGNWTRRSVDGGKTWEEPVRIDVTAPHGPIELKDGRLLFVGMGHQGGHRVIGVMESKDDARSWHYISTIPMGPDVKENQYHEPHVAELPDGKLVMVIRCHPGASDRYLRQAESSDGGRTWTTTHKTVIWGYPGHLLVLDNGWLLCTYGVRRKPYGERACISRDGSVTWDIDNEIEIAPAMNGDLGYPASVQLPDGSIYTVYYQIETAGEKTSLLGTHWRIVIGEDDK